MLILYFIRCSGSDFTFYVHITDFTKYLFIANFAYYVLIADSTCYVLTTDFTYYVLITYSLTSMQFIERPQHCHPGPNEGGLQPAPQEGDEDQDSQN